MSPKTTIDCVARHGFQAEMARRMGADEVILGGPRLYERLAVRAGVLAKPGGYRIHPLPIPMLGGLAIYGAFLVALFLRLYFGDFGQRLRRFVRKAA